mmetsp:Transcript_21525/g.53403  ORF Transcript_21525/g.53403 Transcript_21525/m.53403 type:complete len:200 (-) Transcript_21525:29-628(-)
MVAMAMMSMCALLSAASPLASPQHFSSASLAASTAGAVSRTRFTPFLAAAASASSRAFSKRKISYSKSNPELDMRLAHAMTMSPLIRPLPSYTIHVSSSSWRGSFFCSRHSSLRDTPKPSPSPLRASSSLMRQYSLYDRLSLPMPPSGVSSLDSRDTTGMAPTTLFANFFRLKSLKKLSTAAWFSSTAARTTTADRELR